MTQKAYEWCWQSNDSERFLFVTFHGTETLEDCVECFSEALSDVAHGPLKVLIDLRQSENTLGYDDDMTKLYDMFLAHGISKGIACLIVSNRFFYAKEKLVNEVARIRNKPFIIKSFNNYATARQWLVQYRFPDIMNATES